MNNRELKMTYHPAKKEVLFERFGSAGDKITIRKDSRLYRYMNQKGHFVLQDQGDKFFEDIARAFDGETSVDMDVVTTKSDFGDFEQMIEYYNEGHDVKINATLLAELPDMNSTYAKVKEHGEKAIAILTKHKEDFNTIHSEAPAVKENIDMFSKQVDDFSRQIREKIDCMRDNNINLCFVGAYSTGKSTLINAILGYRILPEAISSETAHMFKILSPKEGEDERICFDIQGYSSKLLWNENKNVFEFGDAPTENTTRKNIQETINEYSGNLKHKQLEEILKNLNRSKDVTSDITVYFHVPLDTKNLQFTIYDTPGTDSNYLEHQEVLEKALSEQTHSILVFVAAPNKLEGSANNALLSYLKEAENKSRKTSIDIARSLFVINMVDNVSDVEELKQLKKSQITYEEDEDFTINLANKKLFFTSAIYALAAKASKNSVATPKDDRFFKNRYEEACNEASGRFYRLNHVATSECAAKKLIAGCDEKMEKALKQGQKSEAMQIASGVYALEKEIQNYGEKYAGAVRAFAIIDSVDKALAKMSTEASSLDRKSNDNINTVDQNMEKLKSSLKTRIEEDYDKYKIKDNEIPDDTRKKLHLDSEYIHKNIEKPIGEFIDKEVKSGLFNAGKVRAKNEHKREVEQEINYILKKYLKNFSISRQQVLEDERDSFIEDIKDTIRSNGNISDEAKAYICDIVPPEVAKVTGDVNVSKLYNDNIRTVKGWFGRKKKVVVKEGFKSDVIKELTNIAVKTKDEFTTDYANAISCILDLVKNEFVSNIDKYSSKMQALLADRKAMEKLREKIKSAEKELEDCQEELNSAIWSVNDNVE